MLIIKKVSYIHIGFKKSGNYYTISIIIIINGTRFYLHLMNGKARNIQVEICHFNFWRKRPTLFEKPVRIINQTLRGFGPLLFLCWLVMGRVPENPRTRPEGFLLNRTRPEPGKNNANPTRPEPRKIANPTRKPEKICIFIKICIKFSLKKLDRKFSVQKY